jgi:hypothetical protein
MIMTKQQMYSGDKKWVKMLDKVANIYNNRKHRRLPNLAPSEVGAEHENLLRETAYKRCTTSVKESKIKVGSRVRISMARSLFDKASELQNWSARLYEVKAIKSTCPLSYVLTELNGEEIKGIFTANELMETKFPHDYLIEKVLKKKSNGQMYVKFYGMNEKGWVDKI